MEKLITIIEKNVYGSTLIYPHCDTAKKFADLIGKKTFSHSDLCKIEALGYVIFNASTALIGK